MSNLLKIDKTHVPYRPNYINFPLKCPICIKNQKVSKIFKSPYALLYHLTNAHDSQDEIQANLNADDIRKVIPIILRAIQWKMFL